PEGRHGLAAAADREGGAGDGHEGFLEPARHDPRAPRRLGHARVAACGLLAHRESLSTSCRAVTRCLKARLPSISITGMSYLCSAYNVGSDSMSTSRSANSTCARATRSASFASLHRQQLALVYRTTSRIINRGAGASGAR